MQTVDRDYKIPFARDYFSVMRRGSFGAELKSAGFDVLIVEGKADKQTCIKIGTALRCSLGTQEPTIDFTTTDLGEAHTVVRADLKIGFYPKARE